MYFASKILFSNKEELSFLQILNQIAIFLLLLLLFFIFAGIDRKLESLPKWIKKTIEFVSSITLEIYVVQYVLIDLIRPAGHFPLNWIILTISILISAFVLRKICELFYSTIEKYKLKLYNGGKIIEFNNNWGMAICT